MPGVRDLRISLGNGGRLELKSKAASRTEALEALNTKLAQGAEGTSDPDAQHTRVADLFADLRRDCGPMSTIDSARRRSRRPSSGKLAALRRAFRLGAQAEKVLRVPFFPSIQVENARKGFFEEAPFRDVLKRLLEPLRVLALVGYWTGWR